MLRIEKSAEDIEAVEAEKYRAEGSVVPSEASTDDEVDRVPSSSKGDARLISGFLSFLGYSGDTTTRLMHKVVYILRTCRYDTMDIASVFAVAGLHHNIFLARHRTHMSHTERTFILLAQIYIAHCVVLDEYCSISNWHKCLFASYCDLKSLNSAVARILKKLDWSLHVNSEQVAELARAFSC